MTPIEELKKEHEAVLATLAILNQIRMDIEATGRIAYPEHLEQLFEFFSVFVDRCHHGKEEDLLFPALEAAGISNHGGPIGVMLKEHQLGRDQVQAMRRALDLYQTGKSEAAGELAGHARTYIELLTEHIRKENEVLFVIAARCLPSPQQTELMKGFDRIEAERIGTGKHEAFHRLIEHLEDTYLNAA